MQMLLGLADVSQEKKEQVTPNPARHIPPSPKHAIIQERSFNMAVTPDK